jgi:hypothetical protein
VVDYGVLCFGWGIVKVSDVYCIIMGLGRWALHSIRVWGTSNVEQYRTRSFHVLLHTKHTTLLLSSELKTQLLNDEKFTITVRFDY